MEAEDEFHSCRPVKAGSVLLEVVEDCSDVDAGVEGAGDAQILYS